MIQSPAGNSPLEHPERVARAAQPGAPAHGRSPMDHRRAAAAGAGRAAGDRVRRRSSRGRSPPTSPAPPRPRRRERFHVDELDGGQGYLLFSTLRWSDQRRAEAAVAQGLASLGEAARRGKGKRQLQSALVSVDPRDGAVLAWVGGRDYEKSQFDRVVQAQAPGRQRLQAGGLRGGAHRGGGHPGVAAQGFADRRPHRQRELAAAELRPRLPRLGDGAHGAGAEPQHPDRAGGPAGGDAAGDRAGARRWGSTGEACEPRPSLALGAFEASPFELAEVYSTLAAGGLRPSIHGLAAVLDRKGGADPGGRPAGPAPGAAGGSRPIW